MPAYLLACRSWHVAAVDPETVIIRSEISTSDEFAVCVSTAKLHRNGVTVKDLNLVPHVAPSCLCVRQRSAV